MAARARSASQRGTPGWALGELVEHLRGGFVRGDRLGGVVRFFVEDAQVGEGRGQVGAEVVGFEVGPLAREPEGGV